jgi:hypothetical protein
MPQTGSADRPRTRTGGLIGNGLYRQASATRTTLRADGRSFERVEQINNPMVVRSYSASGGTLLLL